jgi:hypothetical protein
VAIYHSLDSISPMGYMEVNEQANVASAQPNVREQLRLVNRVDPFHTLDLDYNGPVDDKIHSIARVDSFAVIDHWQSHLLSDGETLVA